MTCPSCGFPLDQDWFWSDEWQAGERQVAEDILAGRVETFDTIEEFLASLRVLDKDD